MVVCHAAVRAREEDEHKTRFEYEHQREELTADGEPTNDCHGNKKDCQCCCKPSCDEKKITDECVQPSTTEMSTLCDKDDGFAGAYSDENSYEEFDPNDLDNNGNSSLINPVNPL